MDLAKTPGMAPPAGQTSNFNGPMSDAQWEFIIISIGVTAGATVTLVLRMWTRAVIVKQVGLDDYAVVAAWLMGIGFFVCCLQWMSYGFGDHLWNVSIAQLEKYAEWSIPVVTTYCWAPMLSKFSILLLFHRLNPSKVFRACIYLLMFVIFAYSLATTLIVSAGCRPTDPTKSQCINVLALTQAIANIVTDGIIVLMPIPMIVKLQLPVGQRIVVGFVLAGGSFVVFASVYRLLMIQQLPGKPDFTWEQAHVCNWSSIEIMVGIMCQCLVTLKPLAKQYMPRLLGYSEDGTKMSIWNRFFSSRNQSGPGRSRSRISLPLDSMARGRSKSSVGKGTTGKVRSGFFRFNGKDNIVITNTYEVQSTYELRVTDSESTEDIVHKRDGSMA